MAVSRASILLALRNVAYWGDTDVLPFPLENHWFHDDPETVADLLTELDTNFDEWRATYPVAFERILSGVGYTGFRSTTHIDPIWNAYLLSLTVELGAAIEASRIPTDANQVFSYRFSPDTEEHTLFDRHIGWRSFQERAVELAGSNRFVLSTDISDFYPRVYHHRIKNALDRVSSNKDACKRIDVILSDLSVGGVSYGLPVGGNAARILAEALLSRTDRLLRDSGVQFLRFVDDYYVFAESQDSLRESLAYLAEILSFHDGLSLSRGKTRIMSAEEFRRHAPMSESSLDSEQSEDAREFLRVRLVYDPYSPTADSDYEQLAKELDRFDVVGMLARELRKSRIDEKLVRQLVKSLKYLDTSLRDAAASSLVQNLKVLYPIFPTVALTLTRLLEDLSDETKEQLFSTLRTLIATGSYVFRVPANLCFAIRLLLYDRSDAATILLTKIHRDTNTLLIRRDITLGMAKRSIDHWVADWCRRSETLSVWERRALYPASYMLGDEGKHWRQRQRGPHKVEQAYRDWIAGKNNGQLWEIPI